jgi:hypothetical protein
MSKYVLGAALNTSLQADFIFCSETSPLECRYAFGAEKTFSPSMDTSMLALALLYVAVILIVSSHFALSRVFTMSAGEKSQKNALF